MKQKNKNKILYLARQLRQNWLLIAITLLGFLLRVWSIDKNPPALNWDEVSHGYNAYSILKTGKDEWGMTLPLIFRAFGDYKLPLYIYLTTIPVAIFGLNAFAVRFVSILAGALAIPGIYLLAKQLIPAELKFKKLTINSGYLAALFLAFLPWHFFISRPALEANLALTLFLFGFLLLLKGLHESKYFLPASILLSLTLHTYNTYRVYTPLVLFFVLILNFKSLKPKKNLNKLLISAAIFFASLAIVAAQVISGTGTARYNKLAILNDQSIFQIGEQRQLSGLPPFLARLRYNRPLYFAEQFSKNYLGYFSPQFVYQTTGTQSQFAIPVKNLFTLPVLILALIGFFITLKTYKQKSSQYLLLLLFLSPVAAALTQGPPQALRPTPMMIPITLFAVLGFRQILGWFDLRVWAKSTVAIILLMSLIIAFTRYENAYWNDYRLQYSSAWQYGYQQAMEYVQDHQSEYDRVFITKYHGEPHIFYAFFSQLNPTELQPNNNNIRFNQSDWYWTDKIGDIYFVNDWEIPAWTQAEYLPLESGPTLPTRNSLLIASVEHLPSNTEILELIEGLDGNIAFIIARFK